jgi:3-hydroxyacyl-CoA dehydrogenase
MANESGELIGIVGVGRMGLAIAKHLMKHGYRVIAQDIDGKAMEGGGAPGAPAPPRHRPGSARRRLSSSSRSAMTTRQRPSCSTRAASWKAWRPAA